jgi:hypothetical protein
VSPFLFVDLIFHFHTSFNGEIDREGWSLTDPGLPTYKVGLQDEVIGWKELPQQAGMPNSIESLRFVEEGHRAVLLLLKGGGYGIDDTMALLDCGVPRLET